ncbi:MAG: hypothetical protein C7B43_21070 [Sulfobacillus benefaciens]|uniref:Uncharacterized protein n=1 Tax=Sulfobacillus benefaciens TaxID=453960 RepID=A0A2T2WHV9_9FIRM|nr:MAG: hypothetical protein C7B43_21070 [Sulfobacillus benefaciens]
MPPLSSYHSERVQSEVWTLLHDACRSFPNLKASLIERDQNFPKSMEEIWADVDTASAIMFAEMGRTESA